MKGRIIVDWKKVDFKSPQDTKKVMAGLQHFMKLPDGEGGYSGKDKSPIRKAIQAFATKGDFPAEILQVIEKYHEVPNYDLGYENIFDIRDYTGSNAAGFKISTVSSGLTFSEVKPGEKAKIYKFSGEVAEVTFARYAGALNWDRTLIDDRDYWTLEDNAVEFRNAAYYSRSAAFYALIEACTGNDTAWAAVTPASVATSNENYNAIRDANTINAACLTILTALKNKGMGSMPTSQMVLVAPAALMGRINFALTKLNQPVVGSLKQQSFNVQPVYTMMLSNNSYYYVCFPKMKIKGGYRQDLTIFDQFDILAYADTMAGWMRYGAAVGDTDQISRCAIA